VTRPASSETLLVYAMRGSELHEKLVTAVLEHRNFFPVDGTWYELITWAPSPEVPDCTRWLARRVIAGAA